MLIKSHSQTGVPLVPADDILRVGGRLSKMPAKSKHPAVLPKDSNLAKLLLSHILVMGISVLFREPDHQDHLSPTGAGSSHNHLYLLQFSQMQPVLTCDLYV